MDDLDRRLLKALQSDGRAHVTTLAHRLDVPRSTVQERIKRLQDRGIVQGFVPVLDHAALGFPVEAHILARFTPDPGVEQREVANRLAKVAGVEAVHVIGGEWDLIIKVRAASTEALADLVLDGIRTVPGVERSVTCTTFYSASGRGLAS